MTSIAAMQCVERGLVTLDADVADILPELAAQGILTGFDEATGEPIINKRQNSMTLRYEIAAHPLHLVSQEDWG